MYAIFKPVVRILLLPFDLIRWLFRAVIWVVALPFRIINAIFKAPFWFFRWLFSLLHRKHTVPASILRIWQETNFADSDVYVLFDSRGKTVQIRLNLFQIKSFLAQYSEGDVGTVAYRGAWLVKWQPASVDRPVAIGTKHGVVFLSYAHEWKLDAKFVAKYLGSRGIKVWFDEERLQVGDSLNKKVIEAIRNSDYFIPMLSQDYYFSKWCNREMETAFKLGCKVLPIKVEEGELVMPPYIDHLYKEDLGDPIFADLRKKNPHAQLDQLISRISA